jgi:hypothetical protein
MTGDGGFKNGTINIHGEKESDAHASASEINYRVGAITKPDRIVGFVIVENAAGLSCRKIQEVEFFPSLPADIVR